MRVAVLGAGIAGATAAYQLVRDGHEVVIVDRQPGVARECSLANGGYVAISQAVPWSSPGVPLKTLRTMAEPDAAILLHVGQLPHMWRWGLDFIACSREGPAWENTKHILRLALYSFALLKRTRDEIGLEYRQRARGTLKVFSDRKAMDDTIAISERQRPMGLSYRVVDKAGCLALAPGLGPSIDTLVGGIHFPDEECGDCHMFANGVADWAVANGAEFRGETLIQGFETDGDRIIGVLTSRGRIEADAYVLATGSETPLLTRSLGLSIPIIPVKGYSVTLPRAPWSEAPELPVLDEMRKFGYMPLGPDHIRVTGFAEIAGYDTVPAERRHRAFVKSFTTLFPGLRACVEASDGKPFCCLRPVTPNGLPILGPGRYRNLFHNIGHGHLGWTLSHGTARIVADLVAGKSPEIDMAGCRPVGGQ